MEVEYDSHGLFECETVALRIPFDLRSRAVAAQRLADDGEPAREALQSLTVDDLGVDGAPLRLVVQVDILAVQHKRLCRNRARLLHVQ